MTKKPEVKKPAPKKGDQFTQLCADLEKSENPVYRDFAASCRKKFGKAG